MAQSIIMVKYHHLLFVARHYRHQSPLRSNHTPPLPSSWWISSASCDQTLSWALIGLETSYRPLIGWCLGLMSTSPRLQNMCKVADNKIELILRILCLGKQFEEFLNFWMCFGRVDIIQRISKDCRYWAKSCITAARTMQPLFLSGHPFPRHILPIRHFSPLDCEQAFSDNTMGPGNLYSCTLGTEELNKQKWAREREGVKRKVGRKSCLDRAHF